MAITPGGLSILHILLLTISLIHLSNLFVNSAIVPTGGKHLSARIHVSPSRELQDFPSGHSESSEHLETRATGCHVEPYDGAIVPQSFPPFDEAKATIYRYRQQQSVNLGSWFVHENWMTPSVFKCAAGEKSSEIDIATGWGSVTKARAVLERHWDTFITQADFQYLASIGINTVRLPIGYWSLGPEFCKGTAFDGVASVYENSWPRIVRAINWANDAGIGVLVDLHGAPGSQNGQAHSGISDGRIGLFNDQTNIQKAMDVLRFLTRELSDVTNVVGIQILNEPKYVDNLETFYTDAIETVRAVSDAAKSLPLYLHDGFNLNKFSHFVSSRSDFVVQDHHSYFVFTAADRAKSVTQHSMDINNAVSHSLAAASNRQRRNLVVDEWSCALNPSSTSQETNVRSAQKEFCKTQLDVYSKNTAGWAFWAYMKEDCEGDAGWCFKSAVGKNLPSSFFSYSDAPVVRSAALDTQSNTAPGTKTSSGCAAKKASKTSKCHHTKPKRQYSIKSRQAASQGYNDGSETAKTFAAFGRSKLGFTGQYIQDHAAKADSLAFNRHHYSGEFMQGLAAGEAAVANGQA